MNRKKHSIKNTLAKLPIVLLYACFFLVQSTFNYDIANLNNGQHFSESKANVVSAHLNKSAENNDKKINIRLNKRFQPESFAVDPIIFIQSPDSYLFTKILASYHNPFIPAYNFAVNTLRGPPSVA